MTCFFAGATVPFKFGRFRASLFVAGVLMGGLFAATRPEFIVCCRLPLVAYCENYGDESSPFDVVKFKIVQMLL